ncbi:hypothetical protein DQ04_13031030, partial [Trypanosoma grayi]|uniref:hypothetical protein n=1 Tax=Trypanosoma grayi TaxID=71804 RepID=UPI0004F4430F
TSMKYCFVQDATTFIPRCRVVVMISRSLCQALGDAGHLIVAPRPSTPYCRGKPGASNVRHLENFAAPGLRHHTVPGPAAPCWDTVLSLSVLGRVLPRHQQYHPHQVTA